jgi:hypothetical protein
LFADSWCHFMLRGVSRLSQIAAKRLSASMPVESICVSVFFWPCML